jgi:hypothetical protein
LFLCSRRIRSFSTITYSISVRIYCLHVYDTIRYDLLCTLWVYNTVFGVRFCSSECAFFLFSSLLKSMDEYSNSLYDNNDKTLVLMVRITLCGLLWV